MSNMTMTKLLRDVKLAERATVHGFRSSFRDWCAEAGKPRELAEAALAHTVGGVEGGVFSERFTCKASPADGPVGGLLDRQRRKKRSCRWCDGGNTMLDQSNVATIADPPGGVRGTGSNSLTRPPRPLTCPGCSCPTTRGDLKKW